MLMFLLAVKFGRMSKKQREKVEDEVRYHRAQMKAQQQEDIRSPDDEARYQRAQMMAQLQDDIRSPESEFEPPSSSDQPTTYVGGYIYKLKQLILIYYNR